MKPYRILYYQFKLNEYFYAQHCAEGLQALGHELHYNADLKPWDAEKAAKQVDGGGYDFILMYGFSFMNAVTLQDNDYLVNQTKVPIVVIFTDNPLRYLHALAPFKNRDVFFFCCDPELVQDMRAEGFTKTYYLPLYFSPKFAYPRGVQSKYAHEVAYAATFRSFESVQKGRHKWTAGMHQKADNVLKKRLDNPGVFVNYYREFKKLSGDPDLPSSDHFLFFVLTLQHIHEQKYLCREELVHALADFHLHVYGQGDYEPRTTNLTMHGPLDQNRQLPNLYSSAKINLCTELHPVNVHQRIFEIAGCGGFSLSEYKADIENLFDYKKEMVCYESLEELPDLTRYYLKHESERKKIAERARERALNQHTATHRMRELTTKLGELL